MNRIHTLILLMLAATTLAASPRRADRPQPSFVATWATAMEPTGVADMPRTTDLTDCSLRQIVHVSLGGERLRLRLSNIFGSDAVDIKSIYIADARDSSLIDPSTARYLTFGGRRSVTIEAGSDTCSDALPYHLRPLQRLAITISYGRTPKNATSHRGSRTTSYIMPGTVKPRQSFATTERVDHWYNIAAIEVATPAADQPTAAKPPVIAVIGNSITDGRGSTTNAQNRWTDIMAESLQGTAGVLNLGIGGNCVIRGGLSQPASERFDRDILQQEGVTHVIVFEGVNDIGWSPSAERTAQELIAAYETFIDKAHARGLTIYGATITPFGGNSYWTHFHEAARAVVNEWIRTSRRFDGVLDFDSLMRDDSQPQRLRQQWQEDWLHPNAAGYKAMGEYAARCFQSQR